MSGRFRSTIDGVVDLVLADNQVNLVTECQVSILLGTREAEGDRKGVGSMRMSETLEPTFGLVVRFFGGEAKLVRLYGIALDLILLVLSTKSS